MKWKERSYVSDDMKRPEAGKSVQTDTIAAAPEGGTATGISMISDVEREKMKKNMIDVKVLLAKDGFYPDHGLHNTITNVDNGIKKEPNSR
jgi:hypothetical protein